MEEWLRVVLEQQAGTDCAVARPEAVLHFARLAEQAHRYEDLDCVMCWYMDAGMPITHDSWSLYCTATSHCRRSTILALRSIQPASSEAENRYHWTYTAKLLRAGASTLERHSAVLERLMQRVPRHALEAKLLVAHRTLQWKEELLSFEAEDALHRGKCCTSLLHALQSLKAETARAMEWERYEHHNERERAAAELGATFAEAVQRLDELGEEEYKEVTLILQLMRDNLAAWSAAEEAGCPSETK